MIRRTTLILALLPALPAARAQDAAEDPIAAALAEPPNVHWQASDSSLHVLYGGEKLFDAVASVRDPQSGELRAAREGEVVFTPSSKGNLQQWKLAPASSGEIALIGELRGSLEAFPAEFQRPDGGLALVRTSVGISQSLRNHAVYDRRWDWALTGPQGATRITLAKRQADSLRFHWESSGETIQLSFQPLLYRNARTTFSFAPWNQRVIKESISGWRTSAAELPDLLKLLSAQRLAEFGVRYLVTQDESALPLIRDAGFAPGLQISATTAIEKLPAISYAELAPAEFVMKLEALRKKVGRDGFLLLRGGSPGAAQGLADGWRKSDAFDPAALVDAGRSRNGILGRVDPGVCELTIADCTLASMAGAALMLQGKPADPSGLECVRRTLPVLFSVPGQLDETEVPRPRSAWWLTEIDRPFDHWSVLGHFGEAKETPVRFADLGLDPATEYLVYEFWSKRFVGAARESFHAPALEKNGTQVFAIRAKLDHPQLLSTSRHISQGAVELTELTWDGGKLALEGVAKFIAGDPYEVVVHVPPGYTPTKARMGVSDVDVRVEGEIARIAITAAISQPMFWTISFKKL